MATSDQVQSLYIAYFGRPADSEGLKYWTADTETPLTTIADGFAATAEYKAAVAGQSDAQVINSFYNNLFNRNAEVEGLNFWLNEIALGKTTVQNVGVVIGQEAVNASPANSDTDCISNKFTAASQWTTDTAATTEGIIAYSGTEGIEAGVNYMNSWGATAPTEAESQAAVDALVADNSTGDTLDLSVLRDIADEAGYTKLSGQAIVSTSGFKLDGQSQTVNGTNLSITDGDVLADSSTSDSDILNVTLTNNTLDTAVASRFSNLEDVRFVLASFDGRTAAGVGADMQNGMAITGATSITVSGSVDNNRNATLDASTTGASTINFSAITGGAASAAVVTAGNGGVTYTGWSGSDNFTGGTGADTVNLGAGDNTFTNAGAGGGADTITVEDAGGSNAIAVTGSGTTTINASVTGVTATITSATTSTVDASGSTAVITINGGVGVDTIDGGSANDVITTGDGATNAVDGNGGNDAITGGSGRDDLSGDAGNDTITGGTGADSLSGGTGIDDFTAIAGQSVVLTAETVTEAAVAATETITFGNGLDIITDFNAGANGDTVDTVAAPITGIGVNMTGDTSAASYFLSGAFVAGTGVFTIAADGTGADTLIFNGDAGANLTAINSFTLLQNVDSDNLVAGNFT